MITYRIHLILVTLNCDVTGVSGNIQSKNSVESRTKQSCPHRLARK